MNRKIGGMGLGGAVLAFLGSAGTAAAQEVDRVSGPNQVGVGAAKGIVDQLGAGPGNTGSFGSARYLIARDPARAIRRGRNLFQRKFKHAEGAGPRTRDGNGPPEQDDPSAPIFENSVGAGLSDSCALCHGRPRGSAGVGGNVFTRPDSRDAPHLFGLGVVEMLADEITADLRAQRDQALSQAKGSGKPVSLSLTSKNIHYGRLTLFPDGRVDTSALEGIDLDLRVKPFFAEGSVVSIREFIVGALQVEMGLQSPDPDILAAHQGARVVTPSGMVLDGGLDPVEVPLVQSASEDGDGDGITN